MISIGAADDQVVRNNRTNSLLFLEMGGIMGFSGNTLVNNVQVISRLSFLGDESVFLEVAQF